MIMSLKNCEIISQAICHEHENRIKTGISALKGAFDDLLVKLCNQLFLKILLKKIIEKNLKLAKPNLNCISFSDYIIG